VVRHPVAGIQWHLNLVIIYKQNIAKFAVRVILGAKADMLSDIFTKRLQWLHKIWRKIIRDINDIASRELHMRLEEELRGRV
jgi:hypothetical protein